MDFYFDSGSSIQVEFSNLFFQGQHKLVGDFYFVSLDLSDSLGQPLKDIQAFIALPYQTSFHSIHSFSEETLQHVVNEFKHQPVVDSSLLLPSFFILNNPKHPNPLFMCMYNPMTYANHSYHKNTFTLVLNSGFLFTLYHCEKFKASISNLYSNHFKRSGALRLYRKLSSFLPLPETWIPMLHVVLVNSEGKIPLALLTALALFPVLPIHNSSLSSSFVNDIHLFSNCFLEINRIKSIQTYLIDRGIVIQNDFLLASPILHRKDQLKKTLEAFSFSLIENENAIHKTVELQKFLEASFYTQEERVALLNVRNGRYAIPNILLQNHLPNTNISILNMVSLRFEWVHKFRSNANPTPFFGLSESILTTYFYVEAEFKYCNDDPAIFAIALSIKTSNTNSSAKGIVVLIQDKEEPNSILESSFIVEQYRHLKTRTLAPIHLEFAFFLIEKHTHIKLSDFPHLDKVNSEIGFEFNSYELQSLMVHQFIKAYIHQAGASSEPIVVNDTAAIKKMDMSQILNSPFYFTLFDEETDTLFFSYYVKNVLTECHPF